MQEATIPKPHSITLDNREDILITGVLDVPGFDEQTVNLLTSMGTLIIKGESLHICRLSLESGEVAVKGRINAMQYLGDVRTKGIVSKLFR